MTLSKKIPSSELHFTYSRSGGPGGQNINKVNTKATIHWNVKESIFLPDDIKERFLKKYMKRINSEGFITLSSQEYRSQNLNAADVVKKLQKMIDSVASAPVKRLKTKPTKASVKKRLSTKKMIGEKKKARTQKF